MRTCYTDLEERGDGNALRFYFREEDDYAEQILQKTPV